MLRTRGPNVEENWDTWLNASVFPYNTTMSRSTGVMLHYTMFGREAALPVDLMFPTPSSEKRTMYHWTRNMSKVCQKAYQSMREVQGGRVRQIVQIHKPFIKTIKKMWLERIQKI